MSEQAEAPLADHAGVRIPPPLIYLALFGLGVLLNWLVPFTFPRVLAVQAAALAFVSCGMLLGLWSILLFRSAHTHVEPVKPTTALVQAGPYRLTRNPIYLGLLCVYIAAALWWGLAWVLLLAPVVVLAVQRLAIAREERYLEHKFGDTYRQYRARVRRWI